MRNHFLFDVGSDNILIHEQAFHKCGAGAAERIEDGVDVFTGEVDHDLGQFWWQHAYLGIAAGFVEVAFGIGVDVLHGYAFADEEA